MRNIVLFMVLSFTFAAGCPSLAENVRITRDIPYAVRDGAELNATALDVYAPLDAEHSPVLMFIHGGGWRIGDKAHVNLKPAYFTEQGFVFVSINYRLSPAVVHPAHVDDVAAAIAWVHKNIGAYGGDPDRISIMGHSAGAHLAALVATDERRLAVHELTPRVLDGVILLDGAGYDLPERFAGSDARSLEIYTTAFGSDPALWRDASPIDHIADRGTIPPFLLIRAGNRPASETQTAALAGALVAVGVRAEVKHAPEKSHRTLNVELGKAGDEPTAWVMEFLQSL